MNRRAFLQIVFLLTLFAALSLLSCENNVYMDPSYVKDTDLWMVNGKYFPTLQEAMDYIYGTTKELKNSKSISDIPLSRTAILQRDVLHSNGETGGGLIVPADFSGGLYIDLNGFTYEFDNSLDHFFKILGGDEVYIQNGTTVIYNEADHEPYAYDVDSKTVYIDASVMDDRRVDPNDSTKSDSKLYNAGPTGQIEVTNAVSTTDDDGNETALTGAVSVVTDGTSGGLIIIKDSRIVLSNIYTRYENADGSISESIPDTTLIPADARGEVRQIGGHVSVENINKVTDFLDGSTLYPKAILTSIKIPDETTQIDTPHDNTDVHDAVEYMKVHNESHPDVNSYPTGYEVWGSNVTHHFIHIFDENWTVTLAPTCETAGSKYRLCTVSDCNAGEGDTPYKQIVAIKNLGHDLEKIEARNPDCTPGNIEHWHCKRCDKYFFDINATSVITPDKLACTTDNGGIIIPALGHLLRHFDAVEPTCQTTGNVEYWLCERCGKSFADFNGDTELASVILDKVDHSYDTTVWNKNETNHWHQCIWCNTTTDVAGHTFTETVTVEPLEHTKGELTKICDVCGHTIIEDIPELDHVYVVTEVVEPTCTERGYTKSECGNPDCQEKIKYDYTDPLGHDGYDVDLVEATCQNEGVNAHFHCNRCNKDYWNSESTEPLTAADIVIAKKPHIPTTEWSSDGTSHWHICLEGGERLDESNHTKIYVNNETKHWHKCSVCGYLYDDEEPHSWTTLGNTTFCEDCGYIPPEETQPTYGGFDVVYTDPIPSGYLSVVQNAAREFTLTVVDTNSNSIPTKFSWYVDGTLVPNETSRSFTYHLPVPNSYEIMCVFSNSKGMGSASKTVYPSR